MAIQGVRLRGCTRARTGGIEQYSSKEEDDQDCGGKDRQTDEV